MLNGRADVLPVLRDALGVRAAGVLGVTDVAIEALPVDFRRLAGGAGVAGTSAWASHRPGGARRGGEGSVRSRYPGPHARPGLVDVLVHVSARSKNKTVLAVRGVYGMLSTRRAPRRCESQPQNRGVGASTTPPATPRTSPVEPAYALELCSLRDSTYPALPALCLSLKPVAERGRQNGRGIPKRARRGASRPPSPPPRRPWCFRVRSNQTSVRCGAPLPGVAPRSPPQPSTLWPAEENSGREK